MMENIKMIKRTGLEIINGVMEPALQVPLRMTRGMDSGKCIGKMEAASKVYGHLAK
jgi:hypothetical protein